MRHRRGTIFSLSPPTPPKVAMNRLMSAAGLCLLVAAHAFPPAPLAAQPAAYADSVLTPVDLPSTDDEDEFGTALQWADEPATAQVPAAYAPARLAALEARILADLRARLKAPRQQAPLDQRLRAMLDLSPEQREDLDRLELDYRQELDWINAQVADNTMTAQVARRRFRAAAALHRQRREALLTPEQTALIEQARYHQVRRPRRTPHPSAVWALARRLDPDRQQITAWYQVLREQRRLLHEMREAGGEPSRQALRQLLAEHRLALEDLLTDAQHALLAQARLERRTPP